MPKGTKLKEVSTNSKKKTLIESSDDEKPIVRKTPVEEITLDDLIQERENNDDKNSQIQESTSESEEKEFNNYVDNFVNRDESVFDFSQGNFPLRVFELIHNPKSDFLSFPAISQEQIRMVQYYPEYIVVSATTLFSLIQHLDIVQTPEAGRIMYNYAQNFPDNSIHFPTWFNFYLECAQISSISIVYLLAISKINKLYFTSDDERTKSYVSLISLYFSAILCPCISESSDFGLALETFRHNLNTISFSSEQISELSSILFQLCLDVPTTNASSIISLCPLSGAGVDIFFQFSLHLINYYFRTRLGSCVHEDQNSNTDYSLNSLLHDLSLLKKLCESTISENIIAASAIIALTEKVVVCSIIKKTSSFETLNRIHNSLKFQINSPDPTSLVTIREQIHVTRSQIELLIKANFDVNLSSCSSD